MAKSSVVLSFHEILLHQTDLDILEGPYWLNDTLISFYFEYLERIIFADARDLLFVSPEVTQCIKMVPADDIKIFLEPLNIHQKNFIFFALNDNDLPDIAGGSHWSLLVYSKPESCIFHVDSSTGSNHNVAWEFASHLMHYLTQGGSMNFVNKECSQQSNGYDCGIFVICNTERMADWAHRKSVVGTCNTVEKINPTTKRKDLLVLVRSLA